MTNKQFEQKMENSLAVGRAAIAEMEDTFKEIQADMDAGSVACIEMAFELFPHDKAKAIKALGEMGYTKDKIRKHGFQI